MPRTLSLLAALMLSFAGAWADDFVTTINISGLNDGHVVSLINFDTGTPIEDFTIADGKVEFRSDRYDPCVINVSVDNTECGRFVLSNDNVVHDVKIEEIPGGVRRTWNVRGGYNDLYKATVKDFFGLRAALDSAVTEQARDSVNRAIHSFFPRKISENADNIFGYYLLVAVQSQLPLDTLENIIDRHPRLADYHQVDSILSSKRAQLATLPGNRFKDFTVATDGVEHKLSDVVGKGDYVLLDFWAFWCVPCREEMPYIKEAYERYKDKNLRVISLAISDSPERDLKMAADLGLTWDVWTGGYDASRLYSVETIPHLILFGPDGTILSRNIRGNNIIPVLSDYLDR